MVENRGSQWNKLLCNYSSSVQRLRVLLRSVLTPDPYFRNDCIRLSQSDAIKYLNHSELLSDSMHISDQLVNKLDPSYFSFSQISVNVWSRWRLIVLIVNLYVIVIFIHQFLLRFFS